MLNRTIILGTTTHIPMTFKDSDGYGIDHSVGSRVTSLMLTAKGATVPAYTLLSTDTNVFAWTTESEGVGEWLFESDDTYTAGEYIASVVYVDPSQTPDTVKLLGEATYVLRNPTTGAL